jgi:peptidoglycan/xylan/chitin deacetylase (PgdA/CDA1 family)
MRAHSLPRAAIAAALCAIAGLGADLSRAEPRKQALVTHAREGEFAPRWREGRFEYGGDGARRWVRGTTPGNGTTALLANRIPYDPPLDFTGRFVEVEVKVEDMARLNGMEFRLSSDGLRSDYFTFGVPLFADAPYNWLQDGAWQTLTFSFGAAVVTGAPDRARIDSIGWVLRDNADPSGERPLVAYWGGLAAVEEPARGIVSLTFDDGYDEHYQLAAPLLAEHSFRGTAYVMPDQIGQPGYMTLAQARELKERYGWDVAAHHFKPFTEFAAPELEALLRRTQAWLTEQGFGHGARHVAYPLGKQDPRVVVPLARRFFDSARLASAAPETLPPGDPYRLRAMNVTRETTPELVQAAVRRAHEHHEWLILMFHWLVEKPEWSTQYAISDFRRILDAIDAEDVRVWPVSQVWAEFGDATRAKDSPAAGAPR